MQSQKQLGQPSRKKNQIKFLKTRLFIDDVLSFIRGWYFKFTEQKIVPMDHHDRWVEISHCSIKINWREELKEINYNRINNMRLGCNLVNNVILHPGEIFSLKKFVGDASEDRGFKDGPTFMNGRLGVSSGGGLCLISTILFNAALEANLKILQKFNHSTDFWGEDRFIDLGRDAAYVFGRKDLKFQNIHDHDVIIKMELSENDLLVHCKILSGKPLNYSVIVENTVIKEMVPKEIASGNLTEDVPYRKGWVVITKRYIDSVNGESDSKKITYRKQEVYKPYIIRS
jgi:vancomycin resistance protein VanW